MIFNTFIKGVAYNGVDQIQVEGKEVLVIGCGAIGLFAIAVAKAKGTIEKLHKVLIPISGVYQLLDYSQIYLKYIIALHTLQCSLVFFLDLKFFPYKTSRDTKARITK